MKAWESSHIYFLDLRQYYKRQWNGHKTNHDKMAKASHIIKNWKGKRIMIMYMIKRTDDTFLEIHNRPLLAFPAYVLIYNEW